MGEALIVRRGSSNKKFYVIAGDELKNRSEVTTSASTGIDTVTIRNLDFATNDYIFLLSYYHGGGYKRSSCFAFTFDIFTEYNNEAKAATISNYTDNEVIFKVDNGDWGVDIDQCFVFELPRY